ncbi:hypothetical protein PFISCL1PPCAC_18351, partial [Pristionchus fissidentatus]
VDALLRRKSLCGVVIGCNHSSRRLGMMIYLLLLLLLSGASTQIDVNSLAGSGDRTSLIFAATIPPNPATTMQIINVTSPFLSANGTALYPALNWTAFNSSIFPTLFPPNFTFPPLNLTGPNGSSWTFPGIFNSNGTFVFPTMLPPTNWTFPGFNNGTFVFPTILPPNFTWPFQNHSGTGGTTPRPFSNPTPATGATRRPNQSTVWWPWSRFTTPATPVSGPTTTPRPGLTSSTGYTPRHGFTARSDFTTGYTPRPGVTSSTDSSTGYTPRYTPSTGYTPRYTPSTGYTPRYTPSTGYTPRYTNWPWYTSRPGNTNWPWFTFGTTPRPGNTNWPWYTSGTTSRPHLSTDVPQSLQQLLQNWRTKFAADMEIVRHNITQFLLQ